MPSLLSSAIRRLPISSSTKGAILGSISSTLTLQPALAKKQANSRPMTPPPMISSCLGSSCSSRMPVESSTAGLSFRPGMGGCAGTEPVAMRILSPAYSLPAQETRPGFRMRASPLTSSTPAPLSMLPTPRISMETTFCLRLCTAARSSVGLPSLRTPNAAACRQSSSALAERSRVLVGMQPTFKQTPPSSSFSKSSTFLPIPAAYAAAS